MIMIAGGVLIGGAAALILIPLLFVLLGVSMVLFFVAFFLLAWLPFVIIGGLVIGTAFAFGWVYID
jgi:hypothetical protein